MRQMWTALQHDGPDHLGLWSIRSVIREVSETGANIGTAKMLKLGGDFTMMM